MLTNGPFYRPSILYFRIIEESPEPIVYLKVIGIITTLHFTLYTNTLWRASDRKN